MGGDAFSRTLQTFIVVIKSLGCPGVMEHRQEIRIIINRSFICQLHNIITAGRSHSLDLPLYLQFRLVSIVYSSMPVSSDLMESCCALPWCDCIKVLLSSGISLSV